MSQTVERRVQSAYDESRYDAAAQPLRERIRAATFRYMVDDLGLSRAEAEERARKEMSGTIPHAVCHELEELGIPIAGKTVLDLGAGLGGLSTALALRDAKVIGVEPGAGWCRIAADRLREVGSGAALQAAGEALPIASGSVDVIVSMQVLEHVQNPRRVIEEAFRVLRPGGYFYFAYENYLSFWEPHYRVFWLPLLPKPAGALYLRMRGRNPQFLSESVTYTTFPAVRSLLAEAGFVCMRRKKSETAMAQGSSTSMKRRLLKALYSVTPSVAMNVITGFDYGKRMFRTAVYECMIKP